MKLSIIIPAYNEEENIVEVIRRVEEAVKIPHELVVVDDHSTDKTAALVRGQLANFKNIRLVENKLPNGFANAIKTGLRNATGDVVVPVMGDLCDDLSTIEKMLEKIKDGYDIACGCRYAKGGARLGGSRFKGFLSFFAGWSLYHMLGIPTRDIANAFKMYRKKVIDSVNLESKGFEISIEIPLKAHYLGFTMADVPTVWHERTKGKSHFKIFKLLPDYLKFYGWAIRKRFTK